MISLDRRKFLQNTAALAFIPIFTACEKENYDEPQKVHWDRDMCERCKMILSEKKHGVQIINIQNGKKYKFDDIGCAILWVKEENINWIDNAKIWITDVKTGKWIDARTAFYDTLNITPMGYGFAAHERKEDIEEGLQIIDFNDVIEKVIEIGR